jgi:hypothetical protein
VTLYYLDSSALVKRYVDEVGSNWLRSHIVAQGQPLLFTSRLTIVEVISAFARRFREGGLPFDEYALARDAFRRDCLTDYQVMPPSLAIVDCACSLLERRPLRAADSMHLAAALCAERFLVEHGSSGLTFLSADDHLNAIAAAENLRVENPNHHA